MPSLLKHPMRKQLSGPLPSLLDTSISLPRSFPASLHTWWTTLRTWFWTLQQAGNKRKAAELNASGLSIPPLSTSSSAGSGKKAKGTSGCGHFLNTFLGTQQDEDAALHEPVDDDPDH